MNKIVILLATLVSGGSFWLADRAVNDLPDRVEVDGRMLRMRIEGTGSPTVILEAGLSGPLEVWDMVQSDVSRFTRVVSYDRIGAVEKKSSLTGKDVARELHAALHNAGVEPPYILVGHSLGGMYSRLFAELYPDDVAGMVLLDPTQEEFLDWMKVHHPKRTLSRHFVKNYAEGAGFAETWEQVRRAPPLPAIPIVVVTGTKFIDDPKRIETLPVWTASHADWVKLQPKGRHVLASNSGHGIQVEAPDLVVDLIRDVVNETRRDGGSKSEDAKDGASADQRGEP
jgi:pimeloyl-ACP methyl ester carboxylesterase